MNAEVALRHLAELRRRREAANRELERVVEMTTPIVAAARDAGVPVAAIADAAGYATRQSIYNLLERAEGGS